MRIGKTWKQKRDAKQAYLKSLYNKEKIWFAWYPVQTDEQTIAWFENVKVRYNIYNEEKYGENYRVYSGDKLKSYYLIEE